MPCPLRPDERRTATAIHQHDGMRLEIRTPGDLESLELAAFDRTHADPGQIEVAVTASASTSPMFSSPWDDSLASTDVDRSWAWISQAW
jgi:hypothetical protein